MGNPVNAVIVEDEGPARRLLVELLAGHTGLVHLSGEAHNGAEAIDLINGSRPGLVFLDIQLPDMSAFDMLRKLDYSPYVIFTTAYDEYAVRAFDALSIDYLLKPLKEDRIIRALNKLQEFVTLKTSLPVWNNLDALSSGLRTPQQSRTLPVKQGNKFTLVQLSDIAYFEAADKYTFVHLLNGQKLFCDHMLAVLEEKLSGDFVRVQKSYIVNRQKVLEVHKYSNNRFTLVVGDRDFTRIVTGPSYLSAVKAAFQV